MSNPLKELNRFGQSVWLDNLSRELVEEGGLAKLIEEDGVSGVTSNPAIFQNSISKSSTYDEQIKDLADDEISTVALFEGLAIQDIRGACDVLKPVYDETNKTDGYVSLEVSPHLARDCDGTIKDAVRLWKAVDRPNVMIKIPGTKEAVPAIEEVLAQGINVNVTLLFSLQAYRDVMEAHLRAMERRLEKNEPLNHVASVASFFLSRIDVMVDKKLDAMAEAGGEHAELAKSLRGRAAIASARLAYQLWKSLYSGPRWQRLLEAGAQVQKPLWASTSTKDPSFPDTKYVEPLIGPQTINTMPEVTVEAYRDHGKPSFSVEDDLHLEEKAMRELEEVGIDMVAVTDALVDEGIDKFIKPFDKLIASLEEKRNALTAS